MHAGLCVHKTVMVGTNFTLLNLQFANCHHFPYIFCYQLTLKYVSQRYMLNTKGLVTLTEYQQVG